MKAYEVMLFLVIFNFTLFLMGSIGLAVIGSNDVKPIAPYDESGIPQDYNYEGNPVLTFVGWAVVDLVGLVSVFVILGAYFGVYNVNMVVISAYLILFWNSYLMAVQVLFQMSNLIPKDQSVASFVFICVFLIFSGVCAYTFIFGGMQIITGPWGVAK